MPHVTSVMCYNNILIPFIELLNKFCEFIVNIIISFGSGIYQCESIIFNRFNYVDPIFNGIHTIGSLFNILNIDNIDSPPTNRYAPSNIRRRKTSTGKHLFSYYARKRRSRQQSIISGSNQSKNDKSHHDTSKDIPPSFRPVETYIDDFRPMDDPSCQDHTWYDAICPYWTGGMIWDSAYVLNHQVVSVYTDPVFVSNLTPALELSATIQTQEPRSEGENVGPRTTIALNSGSSIHIFKDSFLLTDIHADDTRSIGVCTTDSKF
jgi:hypothetical protein